MIIQAGLAWTVLPDGTQTLAAPAEMVAEIERLRAALEEVAAYGGVDKAGGATITISASTALQMRMIARTALDHQQKPASPLSPSPKLEG